MAVPSLYTTVTSVNSGSALASIPLEVLLNITASLATPEYGNVRLTCREIEDSLRNEFAKEFFTKRQFMMTTFSLQALVDIASSRYSNTLTQVIFGLEKPPRAANIYPAWSFLHHPRVAAGAALLDDTTRRHLVRSQHTDHESLLNTGRAVDMMSEAFSKLEKLKIVGIRDFNSRSRNRDFPQNEWRSYGVNTYQAETEALLVRPQFDHGTNALEDFDYLSRVSLDVLHGLGHAGAQPQHLEIILRRGGVLDSTLLIPNPLQSLVRPVLGNLAGLFLDLKLDSQIDNLSTHSSNASLNTPSSSASNSHLMQFLSMTPRLKHLRLNFHSSKDEETKELLLWLTKVPSDTVQGGALITPALGLQPSPMSSGTLEKLEFGMLNVQIKPLVAIIRKHKTTIRGISFHKLRLTAPDPVDPEKRVNLWSKLFSQLMELDLNLSSLSMSNLTQEHTVQKKRGVSTLVLPVIFTDSPRPSIRKWAGTDTRSGFRDLAALVVVSGLLDDVESSESEDSNSEGNSDEHSDDEEDEDEVSDDE